MVKEFRHLALYGKRIFDRVIFEAPFRVIGEFPNEACFLYVVKGQSNLYTPTEIISTQPEEGVVMQCGNYLNEYLNSNDGEYCEAIAIHLYPEVLKMIYDQELPGFLDELDKVKPIPNVHLKASPLLKSYIDSIQFYFDNPSLVSDELLKIKIKELILLLAKTDNVTAIKRLLRGLFSKKELNFREVVEANLFNPLSIEELAALSHLSLSSFKREFAQQYDCPPARYIRQRRLEKAAALLRATDLRISDIAFDCCFQDLAHFSKTFQKEYGLSPSAYRA